MKDLEIITNFHMHLSMQLTISEAGANAKRKHECTKHELYEAMHMTDKIMRN